MMVDSCLLRLWVCVLRMHSSIDTTVPDVDSEECTRTLERNQAMMPYGSSRRRPLILDGVGDAVRELWCEQCTRVSSHSAMIYWRCRCSTNTSSWAYGLGSRDGMAIQACTKSFKALINLVGVSASCQRKPSGHLQLAIRHLFFH